MRTFSSVLVAALTVAVIGVPALPASAAGGDTPPTELVDHGGTAIPLNNKAMILDSKWGPVYSAGQQNSKLNVTVSADHKTITFRDRGIDGWKPGREYFPRHCKKQRVKRGIKATCTILPRFQNGMFVQIWPRLGNDRINGSTLPSWVRFWVLTDKGDDTVYGGAGDDFVNGYTGVDTVHGGDGNDWIRTGQDDDVIYADAGNDELLIGGDGNDEIHGGIGTDKVGGGPGNDLLYGDEGPDNLVCADGTDTTDNDPADTRYQCDAYLP